MVRNPVAVRRWFGAVVLLIALGMLVCGETVLKGRLENLAFIFYWLGCLAFTGLAILVALLDARALRNRGKREQRDLFESTLRDIESQARRQKRPPGGRRNGR